MEKVLGRILAEDIPSPMDVPSFNNSAMDGYVMRFDGKSSPWKVIGVLQAGDTLTIEVGPGEAMRIFTGAKMPGGAELGKVGFDLTVARPMWIFIPFTLLGELLGGYFGVQRFNVRVVKHLLTFVLAGATIKLILI